MGIRYGTCFEGYHPLAADWTVRGWNPGGDEMLRTGPFSWVKRPGRGVVHPPPFSDKVKESSYTSAPPLGLRDLFQGEFNLVIYIFNIDRIVR